MSIHPRAIIMARQLGALIRSYLPEADQGHASLELAAAFQEGMQSGPHRMVPVYLPMQARPNTELAGYTVPQTHNLDAPHVMRLDIGYSHLLISTTAIHDAPEEPSRDEAYGVVMSADQKGDVQVKLAKPGAWPVVGILKKPA